MTERERELALELCEWAPNIPWVERNGVLTAKVGGVEIGVLKSRGNADSFRLLYGQLSVDGSKESCIGRIWSAAMAAYLTTETA